MICDTLKPTVSNQGFVAEAVVIFSRFQVHLTAAKGELFKKIADVGLDMIYLALAQTAAAFFPQFAAAEPSKQLTSNLPLFLCF